MTQNSQRKDISTVLNSHVAGQLICLECRELKESNFSSFSQANYQQQVSPEMNMHQCHNENHKNRFSNLTPLNIGKDNIMYFRQGQLQKETSVQRLNEN